MFTKRIGARKALAAASKADFCVYCGQSFTEDDPATVDHLSPVARGGDNLLDNLVWAHFRCNQFKGDRFLHEIRFPGEWMVERAIRLAVRTLGRIPEPGELDVEGVVGWKGSLVLGECLRRYAKRQLLRHQSRKAKSAWRQRRPVSKREAWL